MSVMFSLLSVQFALDNSFANFFKINIAEHVLALVT